MPGRLSLRARIAKALGWTEAETCSFALIQLRELVRTVDADLAHEITSIIASDKMLTGVV